ncbi:energy-coupling factor transporter ATP-binding protein EcfA2 [Philodulcilactobacillus myokoensis]|uniref:Energy-coupling factor transporter ATP-binding protein EcfA2 n=1 Tax=Philodulcilactobacillus myokoensis TaxID=2929573 RepID=A0A9W6B257_9LACO|nr:energy-coupling factor transporter ATPase [Philodulcilactobacillus myokoensis]GLB47515.1 energy-coupling factor transporter ATP-binding protein EcfA2 [Philodulcilactobacillus myokoensis]
MAIQFKNVSYVYHQNAKQPFEALKNINFHIQTGSLTAIIGQTGSGKSTLIRHLNGLLHPTKGEVIIDHFHIDNKTDDANLYELRKKVGVIFQFPEHQLFAKTVLDDVSFGSINFGFKKSIAIKNAKDSLKLLGVNEHWFHQAPLELSGGQMRRVALAGVLAFHPKILVLDEPTAGLDPNGHRQIMAIIKSLQVEQHVTIIMVTHSMNDVANYADQVIVMQNGKLLQSTTPKKLFQNIPFLKQHHLGLP